jgi:hypothetical protein
MYDLLAPHMKTFIFVIALCGSLNAQGLRPLTQAELLNLAAQESAAAAIESSIEAQTEMQRQILIQLQDQQRYEQFLERMRLMNQQLNSNSLIHAN